MSKSYCKAAWGHFDPKVAKAVKTSTSRNIRRKTKIMITVEEFDDLPGKKIDANCSWLNIAWERFYGGIVDPDNYPDWYRRRKFTADGKRRK